MITRPPTPPDPEPPPRPYGEPPERPGVEPPAPPIHRRRGRLLTPVRVTLAIALAVSAGVVGYGLLVRDATQMPVLTAGTYIVGIVFALLALAGAWAAFSRAREGSGGRALIYAVLGGVAALLAAGAIAGAIILTLTLDS